jgi:hypothetical protein
MAAKQEYETAGTPLMTPPSHYTFTQPSQDLRTDP